MTTKTKDLGRKIIRPYSRKPLDENTLEGTLHKYKYTSVPGSVKKLFPRTDAKGRIRTGIDENATKVLSIRDASLREQEQERLKAIRLDLEYRLGESLEPDSPFWNDIKGNLDNAGDAGGYGLEDKDNIFDMNNPMHAVNYYWLMETGFIAPSLAAIEDGEVDPSVYFYVHDDEITASVQYERKQRINKVKLSLETMGDIRRKQIAKLLGLGISETSSAQKVYVALDEYLSTPKAMLDTDPIDNFQKYTEMSEELVAIKALAQDLIKYNIVRLTGSIVKEGEYIWGKTVEEFELLLIDPANSEILVSFEDKLRNKLKIDSI
jgi:hypothetical protein